MKKNISTIDRVLRILVAAIVIVLYFTNVISGTVAIVLLAVAAIFLLTSFIGFCPIYFTFGIGTRPKNELAKKL